MSISSIRPCPFCRKTIGGEVERCPHCGTNVRPEDIALLRNVAGCKQAAAPLAAARGMSVKQFRDEARAYEDAAGEWCHSSRKLITEIALRRGLDPDRLYRFLRDRGLIDAP